jgi:hypothetical protein
MYQPIHPRSPLETMPTMYDLPSEGYLLQFFEFMVALVRSRKLDTNFEKTEAESQRANKLAAYL